MLLTSKKSSIEAVTEIKINTKSLFDNIELIKSYAPNRKILAMLKGNAYGHGLTLIAKKLKHVVDAIGVMHAHDALLLRKAGVTTKIVMLGGFSSSQELLELAKLECDLVLHSDYQIDIVKHISLPNKVSVWLKANLGMNRLGFSCQKILEHYYSLILSKNVDPEVNLMSHLSHSDELNSPISQEQVNQFASLAKQLPCRTSLCNSAAIIQKQGLQYSDWIRPGLILFGISPIKNYIGKDLNLRIVMTYQTRLIAIRRHKKGDYVGYGGKWACPEDNMLIGIVPVGYAESYPRNITRPVPVYIREKRCYIIPQTSMHMLFIDLSNCLTAKPGDLVTLWGEPLSIEEVANELFTIPNEILVKLPTWVNRKLL